MKKLFFALALACTSLTSFASNETPTEVKGNDPVVQTATAAIKKACPNANGKLNYSVNVVSSCFAGGFITEVSFWKTPNCPPNQPCIQIVEMVGTVTIGCDGEVIGITCDGPVAQ